MENKLVKRWSVFTLWVVLLVGFANQAKADPIDLRGEWKDNKRSISSEVPVTASFETSLLSIQSRHQSSDIKICISRNGASVYEKTIPASETSLVAIDMSSWEEGEYVLELRNERGGYLYGRFEILQ